jgi:hypothetical protein
LPYLGERWSFVAVDSDEELFGVEAVNLDEAVVVGDGPVDDDEDEVVVLVELCSLLELFGVLDGERVELEDLAEDRVVILVWLIEVEPEEPFAGEEFLDVLAVEVQLLVAAVVNDRAGVRSGPSSSLSRIAGWRLRRDCGVVSWRCVFAQRGLSGLRCRSNRRRRRARLSWRLRQALIATMLKRNTPKLPAAAVKAPKGRS